MRSGILYYIAGNEIFTPRKLPAIRYTNTIKFAFKTGQLVYSANACMHCMHATQVSHCPIKVIISGLFSYGGHFRMFPIVKSIIQTLKLRNYSTAIESTSLS